MLFLIIDGKLLYTLMPLVQLFISLLDTLLVLHAWMTMPAVAQSSKMLLSTMASKGPFITSPSQQPRMEEFFMISLVGCLPTIMMPMPTWWSLMTDSLMRSWPPLQTTPIVPFPPRTSDLFMIRHPCCSTTMPGTILSSFWYAANDTLHSSICTIPASCFIYLSWCTGSSWDPCPPGTLDSSASSSSPVSHSRRHVLSELHTRLQSSTTPSRFYQNCSAGPPPGWGTRRLSGSHSPSASLLAPWSCPSYGRTLRVLELHSLLIDSSVHLHHCVAAQRIHGREQRGVGIFLVVGILVNMLHLVGLVHHLFKWPFAHASIISNIHTSWKYYHYYHRQTYFLIVSCWSHTFFREITTNLHPL